MFKSYSKTVLRNLTQHKSDSIVSIFGLSSGIACGMLTLFFVSKELSQDTF